MLRLELLRKEKNLSQDELAKKVNMTQQRISAYEKGKREPDLETLKFLSDYFNVTTDFMLGKSEIRNLEELKNTSSTDEGKLDIQGLDKDDLLEIQKQVDYIKKLKRKK